MKTVFMGTPDFAVSPLNELVKAGFEVGYVITQPDRAKNRGKKVQFSPVKEAAIAHGIEVLQPERIKKSPETLEILREYNPDIIVVAAYGQIIQKEILELPKYGCINVHASLLPELRGASPIQHAILEGKEKTGVTIMQMAEGLDTGDMLSKAEVEINKMTGEELHDALSKAGAELLVKTLPEIEAGTIDPIKQDDRLATYAGMISKKDGEIDFSKFPEEIERQIRAFEPWPGAFCHYKDIVMKVCDAECMDIETECADGTIVNVSEQGIDVACRKRILRIKEIQMPGKKRVAVSDYLKGNTIEKGWILR